jgi:hypothetical protein
MKIFSLVFLLALFLYQVNGACVDKGLLDNPKVMAYGGYGGYGGYGFKRAGFEEEPTN